jgi:hypothetical protein
MPPLDTQIVELLKPLAGTTKIVVTPWNVDGKTLREIENDAKVIVRRTKPDLVLIAVPRMKSANSETKPAETKANAASKTAATQDTEAFVNAYAWIMNWSLNFGPPTWDVVVVHPSVNSPIKGGDRDDLIRQLVRAQDLSLIDRITGDADSGSAIFGRWLKAQFE